MAQYLRQVDILGQPEVTPEQATANKIAGKGPRRPRPAKPARYTFSSATFWRMIRDGRFPAPVRLSAGVTAWRLEDIEAWEAARKSDGLPAPSANLRAAWAARARAGAADRVAA